MNRRQKKKRYKKLFGRNPPRDWNGKPGTIKVKYARGGLLMPVGTVTEETEKINIEKMQEQIASLSLVCSKFGESIEQVARACRKAFEALAEKFTVVKEKPDPCVTVAKALSERRKKRCLKRNQWK